MSHEPYDIKLSLIVDFFKHDKQLLQAAEYAIDAGQVIKCEYDLEAKMLNGLVSAPDGDIFYKVEVKFARLMNGC